MRDGVRLAVDVFRPDAKGQFPALLSISPYGKEIQSLPLPPQTLGKSALWDGNIEAGDPFYIVPRGYVHVIGDLRGTGYSEGENVGRVVKHEGEDGHDLVEWIAQQPWCDGNVGMVGHSYFGQVQVPVALQQPPHLKAIFPSRMSADAYQNAYPGGILGLFYYGLWDGRLGTSGYAPRNCVSEMVKRLSREELERRVEEALNNPDIRTFPNLYHLLKYPQKNPFFFDFLLNPLNGPFYSERSTCDKFDGVRTPVCVAGQWGFLFAPGFEINLYLAANAPKKLIMYAAGSPERPWRQALDKVIRWYDHWLKGIDTGMMDGPPIELFVMGANQWRYEDEWPLPGTQWEKWYLRGWEGLSPEPEIFNDEPDCFAQQPLYLASKTQLIEYLSPPMPEDRDAIGPVAFHFFASIDTDDANWIVSLYDVDERGAAVYLSRGCLKASHRALDETRSKPWQPCHPHTSSEPVTPDKIYGYAIGLAPISNRFRKGHRIRLEIKSILSPRDPECLVHFHPLLPSSKTTVHKIYRDKQHESHLLLPFVPKKE